MYNFYVEHLVNKKIHFYNLTKIIKKLVTFATIFLQNRDQEMIHILACTDILAVKQIDTTSYKSG